MSSALQLKHEINYTFTLHMANSISHCFNSKTTYLDSSSPERSKIAFKISDRKSGTSSAKFMTPRSVESRREGTAVEATLVVLALILAENSSLMIFNRRWMILLAADSEIAALFSRSDVL